MLSRALALATACCLLAAPAAAAAATSTSTLGVSGNGAAFVTPDVATLFVSVNRSAPSAAAARSAANRTTAAVLAGVKRLGIADADVQTTEVRLARRSVLVGRRGHRHRRVRYFASNSLTVRVTSIALAGRVVDAATVAKADEIHGPDYSFSDPSAGTRLATRSALTDARRRADEAAAQLGYVVTGVQSVDLDPGDGALPDEGRRQQSVAAPSRPTVVKPGREEVDVTVRVVYTIAPR